MATSLFGTGMAPVAVAFAVLNSGGSPSDLGYVLTAGVGATVVCLLLGGVAADRFGRPTWRSVVAPVACKPHERHARSTVDLLADNLRLVR